MIKLIATDMDGTLLDSKGNLSPEFYNLLDQLNKKGILFAIASGRQYFTLVENFKERAKELLFIAENGTYVAYKGEMLTVHPLKKEIAHKLIRRGRMLGVDVILATSKGAFIESKNDEFTKEVSKYYIRNEYVEDLLKVEGDILKVTVYDPRGVEENAYLGFKDLNEDAQITIAGHSWIDMMAQGVNKGTAIKDIQHKLSISYEETMAFGDYLNDVEMLQSVYFSYAMENAHPKIKEIARFGAKSNDENGVILKIKEMIENES